MPYRRLPKTDQARLHALKKAVHRAGEVEFNQQAINYKTLIEAQRLLMQFENQVAQYHANVDTKVSDNKQYRHKVRNARMYISHFIQVLNLAAIISIQTIIPYQTSAPKRTLSHGEKTSSRESMHALVRADFLFTTLPSTRCKYTMIYSANTTTPISCTRRHMTAYMNLPSLCAVRSTYSSSTSGIK